MAEDVTTFLTLSSSKSDWPSKDKSMNLMTCFGIGLTQALCSWRLMMFWRSLELWPYMVMAIPVLYKQQFCETLLWLTVCYISSNVQGPGGEWSPPSFWDSLYCCTVVITLCQISAYDCYCMIQTDLHCIYMHDCVCIHLTCWTVAYFFLIIVKVMCMLCTSFLLLHTCIPVPHSYKLIYTLDQSVVWVSESDTWIGRHNRQLLFTEVSLQGTMIWLCHTWSTTAKMPRYLQQKIDYALQEWI